MPKKAEKISDVQGQALDNLYLVQQRVRKKKGKVRGYVLSASDKAGRSWDTHRLGPAMFKKGLVIGCTPSGECKADYTGLYRLTVKGEALAEARARARKDVKAAHMEKCAEYDKSHKTYHVTVRVSMDLTVVLAAKDIHEAQEKILAGQSEDCYLNGFGKVRAVAVREDERDRKREVVAIREVPQIAPHRLDGELRNQHGVTTPRYREFEEEE